MNCGTENPGRRPLAIAVALVLAACGGGGGGDAGGSVQPSLVTIGASNQDMVAHAAAAALGTIAVGNVLPSSASPGLAHPLAAGGTATGIVPWAAWLPAHVTDLVIRQTAAGVSPTSTARRALTVYAPESQPCTISGSMALTWDDRNGNGSLDAGDAIGMQFNACVDDATGALDGHVDATVTALGSTSMSLTLVMSGLASTAPNHALAVNGTMTADVAMDAGGNTATLRLSAQGPLTITAHTHGFDDTVTLQAGFAQNARFDADGTSHVTLTGRFGSTALAGAVDVSTLAEVVSAPTDAYPSAGSIRLAGKAGKLTLTAAGANAKMDLDDNDDNAIEASKTVSWDWLL